MADSTLGTSLPLPSFSAAPHALPLPVAGGWRAEWCGAESWTPLLPAWRAAQSRHAPDDLGADPDWCHALNQIYPGAVRLLLLRQGRDVAAVIPLLVRRQPLDCHLGEWRVVRFHPRVVQLAGERPALPDEPGACHALFQALLRDPAAPGFDMLRFVLPTASQLWQYLASQDFAHFGLRRYEPTPPVLHHLIQLPPTFAEYQAKFTPKTRKNRAREVKYLEQRGPVELIQFSRPDQVDAFLAAADALSRRSYQHKLLKVGLRAPAQLRRRLQVAAERGWWRSYMLRCGGADCSYMLGYQFHGRYLYTQIAYDPAWAKLCVGTVLQWLVLQDLFRHDPPATFDFGAHGPQKQYFGNQAFLEGNVTFFRPGPYPWLARTSHHAGRQATAAASALLDRYQLKSQVQRLLRRLRGC